MLTIKYYQALGLNAVTGSAAPFLAHACHACGRDEVMLEHIQRSDIGEDDFHTR
jgi:hypothetical protein